ncbi:UPAR/Ly6 domain-containing protein crok [Drosophila montana]|uniref:UPAR/Ly6 domain-containing protein crok n=1 Tax=Drosophila montana TaxID=40370 RepID=UPI00313E3A6C
MSPFMEKTLLLLGVLCCIQVTTALMCYDCNSEYDPRCGDPFEPYSIGEVNCSKQEPLEHLKDKYKPMLCRKTVQKIYGKVRIVRGCGYIPDERTDKECIRRLGTHDVSATYCACTHELCNGATAVGQSQMPLLFALAAGFALFLTRHSIRVQSS